MSIIIISLPEIRSNLTKYEQAKKLDQLKRPGIYETGLVNLVLQTTARWKRDIDIQVILAYNQYHDESLHPIDGVTERNG